MFNRNKYPAAERKQIRDAITAEIIQDVAAAVDELLADTPTDWPKNVPDEIKKTVLEHASWVVDGLSLSELQSRVARKIFEVNTASEVRNLIHLQADRERRHAH